MHEDSTTPQHRVPRVTLHCRQCKRPFEVLASQSLRTGRPYCDLDCAKKGKATPMEARFWAGVEMTPSGCWIWKRAFSHGRPILALPGHGAGYVRADIYSYELHFEPLPPGGKMHQTCGNYGCVNPDHMAPGPRPRKERAKKPPSPNARPPKVECICALPSCGKAFSVWPSRFAHGKEVKYCSKECQGKAKARSLEERFWEKVEINGPLPPDHPELGPCSIWKGAINANGYGVLSFDGKKMMIASRIALILDGRPAPADGDACHHCDVRACVRFDHLFPGSKPDNIQDMVAKERNTAFLNPCAILVIRFMWEHRQATQAALARAYCVHPTTIQRIIRRQSWSHVV